MRLQRNGDGFCIDAGYLGGLLAVPVDRVQALMRANAIRCVCERGEGEHAGRYRLTFIHGRRRVRLDLDGSGTVLRRSHVDLAGRISAWPQARSEARWVGKECVSRGSYRWEGY